MKFLSNDNFNHLIRNIPLHLNYQYIGLGRKFLRFFKDFRFIFQLEEYNYPSQKNTEWFRQEYTENHWNMEAVFPSKIFRIFFDEFRPAPAGKHRKSTGIHRKKFRKFPVGILLPLLAVSGAFLQDPVAIIFDLDSVQ